MVEYSIEVDAKALANNLLRWDREFPGFIQQFFGRIGQSIAARANAKAKQVLKVWTGDLSTSNQFEANSDSLVVLNTMSYAGVHEFGFSGTVTVPAHTRTMVFGKRAKVPFTVGPYSRRMNIRPRPFVRPTLNDFFAGGEAEDIATGLFASHKRRMGFE